MYCSQLTVENVVAEPTNISLMVFSSERFMGNQKCASPEYLSHSKDPRYTTSTKVVQQNNSVGFRFSVTAHQLGIDYRAPPQVLSFTHERVELNVRLQAERKARGGHRAPDGCLAGRLML
eukprot:scaffold585103_cov19-Prasinocladus_malaysianus.AAC.1